METQNKKRNWIKHIKILRVFLMVVLIFVVLIGGVIIYFESHLFDINEQPLTIESFIQNTDPAQDFIVNGNLVHMNIPKEVITTEVALKVRDFTLGEGYSIRGMRVTDQGRLEVNASYRGFDWAFSAAIHFTTDKNQVVMTVSDLNITDEPVEIAYETQQQLLAKLFGNSFPIRFDIPNMDEIISLESFIYENNTYQLTLQVNDDLIMDELRMIKENVNPELLSMYKESDDSNDVQAASYISGVSTLGSDEIGQIIRDYLNDKKIIKGILSMGHIDYVVSLYDRYGKYFGGINQQDLIDTQGTVLSGNLMVYYNELMDTLNQFYFVNEYMYINNGRPYSFESGAYTIERINVEQEVGIPSTLIPKIRFVYDELSGVLKLSYEVDEDTYLLVSDMDQYMMTKEAYNVNYDINEVADSHYTSDVVLWEAVQDHAKAYFSVEDVYVRYLKDDGTHVFAVISPASSYQNYWVFAYTWIDSRLTLVMDNVPSIQALNEAYPWFNLEVVTTEIDEVTVYKLNDEKKATILQDLENKGLINSISSSQILYCSKGNDYISLLLDQGQEYIYYVYGTHLHTVYNKAYGLTVWDDVPDIITLQEQPE